MILKKYMWIKKQSVTHKSENISHQCAVILLAAGSSSRMGKPKQLLEYKEYNFLSHMLNIISSCKAGIVIVVLGANAEILEKEIDDKKVFKVMNNEWKEGIASSIRCGLTALPAILPSCEAVLLVTCDQPYVSASLLNDLIDTHTETGKPIVASSYANTYGIPALFHKSLFAELKNLKGDIGAKKIILEHKNLVAEIPFPLGNIDIDTMDDYKALNETVFENEFK